MDLVGILNFFIYVKCDIFFYRVTFIGCGTISLIKFFLYTRYYWRAQDPC